MKKSILILLFLVNLGAIISLWLYGSFSYLASGSPGQILIAWGRLCGLLAEFLILTELLLISRMPFIEHAFGFDTLNKIHRWIGYGLLGSILAHPLFLLFGYANVQALSLGAQIKDFIFNWEDIVNALLGITLVLLVGFVSLPFIRKRMKYESWHIIHLGMYVALLLFFGHQTNTGDASAGIALFYWLILNFSTFGVLAVFRFVRPLWLYWRHRFFVEKVMQETHNVWSVYIAGKSMEKFHFEAGQYIHILFWMKGMRQPHPFSLSQAYDGKRLRVSIKAVGDFTSQISTVTPGTPVLLEGPFGRFTARVARTKKYAFIAGGIGITPIRALVESLEGKEHIDGVLLYGNRHQKDIAFEQELAPRIHIDHIFSEESLPSYESGRVDAEKIKRLVPDIVERDIYLCGPAPMMDSVIRILATLGVPRSQVHFEKFAY